MARPVSPLGNIKIADFSWSVVGPSITAYLSYYGADVVKVESVYSPEVTRRSSPYKDGIVGIDRSFAFAALNTNKYSICLNLKHPAGREVALQLVSWADVAVRSATSNTLEKLGLSYDDLKRVNENIIVLDTSNQGQTGAYSNHPGYGDSVVALSGFPEVIGWPDREPSIPPGAYTDSVTPWFGTLAILAALEYRNRTGIGQHIDLAQLEVGLNMLMPAFLTYSANGVMLKRDGNRSPVDAPHGVYRCLGDNRWCAIAITSEEEWQAFCRVMDNPDWTREPRFATMTQRKENEEELDRLIEAWTANLTAEEVMARLQNAGVAAGVVDNIDDLHHDPQLEYRSHFRDVEHPLIGNYSIQLPPLRLSAGEAEVRGPAPRLGEHTEFVCCELLKMPTDEFVRLHSEGVFE